MKKMRKTSLVIAFLIITNLLTAGFWAYKSTEWQTEMYGMASYAASLQALSHFKSGKLRLLETTTSDKMEFTGKIEGPFEIWSWPSKSMNPSNTYSANTFIYSYNRKMKYMHAHPEDFTQKEIKP